MAGPKDQAVAHQAVSVGHHETALAIIPPRNLWGAIERLRALYDKHFEQWPPHINLIYPFAHPDSLERACELMQPALRSCAEGLEEAAEAPLTLRLDSADAFRHRDSHTIFIQDSDKERTARLHQLRSAIMKALGHSPGGNYRMHMSVAQTEDGAGLSHEFLRHKAGLLPAIEWQVGELHVLVRERLKNQRISSRMRLWGTLDLSTGRLTQLENPLPFYDSIETAMSSDPRQVDEPTGQDDSKSRPCYRFNEADARWDVVGPAPQPKAAEEGSAAITMPKQWAVASYNVLAEFEWPPSRARYPLLLRNILSERAGADVLVLQEVQDDFLSFLLGDEEVRRRYPFASHNPPSQQDAEPLPSLLNIVVLSRWDFEWEWVSFHRKHKGSVVARFPGVGRQDKDAFLPLVLATVHLSHGLTDGAVAAKKVEMQNIVDHLTEMYPGHPWILAGDFNLPSSSYTIDMAHKTQAISSQTRGVLARIERMLAEASFLDSWAVSRSAIGDDAESEGIEAGLDSTLFEGEQGATYDPTTNTLAAAIVGSGYGMRPQRIDRILVKGEGLLSVARFNQFGLIRGDVENQASDTGETVTFASDHWGVRCIFKLGQAQAVDDGQAGALETVELTAATGHLADVDELKSSLAALNVLPTEEDAEKRHKSFEILKTTIVDAASGNVPAARSKANIVVVPVGSYGLGVWTSSSDIDCLCIGPFSSRTFFALITQKLRRGGSDIKLLRRVNAASGTMLELEVNGIKTDLQYCPATAITERWPDVLRLPSSDPVFTLPTQSLSKLKSARDLDYILRSAPDLAAFRLAHRLIRAWAVSRGVYAAKFGFLGGIMVSVLLARVHKLLVRDFGSSVTVPDLLRSFFRSYAAFDWKGRMAFDPFFFNRQGQQQQNRPLPHVRTAREPLVVLGYYPPALNLTHAASRPSARTLADEFRRADALLSREDMTWAGFLLAGEGTSATTTTGPAVQLQSGGAADFLHEFKSYIKIDVQYWGMSPTRGAVFVGWLESRCVQLLVDVGRRAPTLHARVWPARFVEAADVDVDIAADADADATTREDDNELEYKACYLIGLDKAEDDMPRDELKAALGALQAVLNRFEEYIRGDEKHYESKTCWMGASVVSQRELGALRVDGRSWADFTPGDDEVDDDDEEEEEDQELEAEDDPDMLLGTSADEEGGSLRASASRKHKKQNAQSTSRVTVPKPEGAGKFRMSGDVINRLRWDPGLDSGDYIVGYEDRFLGAKERALDAWKTEQTDEEFIPQHRILYFKRKSDGVVVWDRRARKDELFGSGV